MAMKKEGFFGTDNIHRAIWGLLGAGLMLILTKGLGPQRVVVEAHPEAKVGGSAAQPIQVNIESAPSKQDIKDLTNAIGKLAQANVNTKGKSESEQSAEQKRVQSLAAEVDRLRAQVTLANAPVATATGVPSSVNGTAPIHANLVKFTKPSIVKGYTHAKLIGSSAITCPDENAVSGQPLTATFNFNNAKLLLRASPVEATLALIRGPLDQLQIAQNLTPLRLGKNTVTLTPAKLGRGEYEFTFGFYLIDELNVEFPKLYGQQCRVVIS